MRAALGCALIAVALPFPTEAASGPSATVEERHRRAAQGFHLPSTEEFDEWRQRDRWHRQVVDILADRENWARALAECEQRLGLFREDLDVRVTLEEGQRDTRAALAGGRNGRGWIRFQMATLADYARTLHDFEIRARNPRAVVIVPPCRIERMVWHEVTHALQNDINAPDWFREGMACFAEQNDSHLVGFLWRREMMADLASEVPQESSYGRGWLFWQWLDNEFGREAVRDCVRRAVQEGQPWRQAIESATGISWDQVVQREFEYSRGVYNRERERLEQLRRSSRR